MFNACLESVCNCLCVCYSIFVCVCVFASVCVSVCALATRRHHCKLAAESC